MTQANGPRDFNFQAWKLNTILKQAWWNWTLEIRNGNSRTYNQWKLIGELIDNQEIKDIIITDNDINDKFDAIDAQPSLNIEQQRQRQNPQTKQTNQENKKIT